MTFLFHKTVPNQGSNTNSAFLSENNWDDFGFKSLFYLIVFDENGNKHDIGNVKIGYFDQETGWTRDKIPEQFENLEKQFFSLGQEAEYYQNIREKLSPELGKLLLTGLRDVVNNDTLLESVKDTSVFNSSLLRTVSMSAIHEQYKRILSGDAVLTKFHFSYKKQKNELNAGVELDFNIAPYLKPSTNIHILIGRNGVGKTTLLNNMVRSIVDSNATEEEVGRFYDLSKFYTIIYKNYFSSVVSISFSAFDPFIPPPDQVNKNQGTCYFYIGLKQNKEKEGRISKLKDLPELCNDFVKSLEICLSLNAKKERWLSAICKLESDMNFAEMELARLATIKDSQELKTKAEHLFLRNISSGHAIVLLSITKLIETVEEKTLVLIDEPETHLHPPLLSAFTRALSDLLINRNGIAIIATHSPVVLQEVPKSCVWKLRRTRSVAHAERPESETFGENVGVLTREVFGLEVAKSGFHELLQNSIADGKSYEEILKYYNGQLGFEGKAILRALIARRDKD